MWQGSKSKTHKDKCKVIIQRQTGEDVEAEDMVKIKQFYSEKGKHRGRRSEAEEVRAELKKKKPAPACDKESNKPEVPEAANVRAAEEEKQRTVGVIRASQDEQWISSRQGSVMVSAPLSILSGSIVRRWVISCQSPAQVPPTQGDLLWISPSEAGRSRLLTVTGVHFQLPSAYCHCGLFIQSEFTHIFKR